MPTFAIASRHLASEPKPRFPRDDGIAPDPLVHTAVTTFYVRASDEDEAVEKLRNYLEMWYDSEDDRTLEHPKQVR